MKRKYIIKKKQLFRKIEINRKPVGNVLQLEQVSQQLQRHHNGVQMFLYRIEMIVFEPVCKIINLQLLMQVINK